MKLIVIEAVYQKSRRVIEIGDENKWFEAADSPFRLLRLCFNVLAEYIFRMVESR
jgi:hypothetical protein